MNHCLGASAWALLPSRNASLSVTSFLHILLLGGSRSDRLPDVATAAESLAALELAGHVAAVGQTILLCTFLGECASFQSRLHRSAAHQGSWQRWYLQELQPQLQLIPFASQHGWDLPISKKKIWLERNNLGSQEMPETLKSNSTPSTLANHQASRRTMALRWEEQWVHPRWNEGLVGLWG